MTSASAGFTEGPSSVSMTAGQTGTLPSEPAGFVPIGQGPARDKLDLLMMIDNSLSMFQKQALLAVYHEFRGHDTDSIDPLDTIDPLDPLGLLRDDPFDVPGDGGAER